MRQSAHQRANPLARPPATAPSPTATLTTTFPRTSRMRPSSSRRTVSKVKVEKVVYAPQNRRSSSNDPVMLIMNVPYGKSDSMRLLMARSSR
jgi:hypothetical protein